MRSNKDVALAWANRHKSHGKGSHFFFEGDTIYSYGTHFAIARHSSYKGKPLVLFTTRGYSNATERHKSIVRSVISNMHVIPVQEPREPLDPQEAREYFKSCLDNLMSKAARARYYGEWYLQQLTRDMDAYNQTMDLLELERFVLPDNLEQVKEIVIARKVARVLSGDRIPY